MYLFKKALQIPLVLFLFINTISLHAQQLTKSDYNRAVQHLYENLNNKKVFNLYTEAHWFEDSTGFWFIHHSENGKEYRQVQFSDMKIQPFFDHEKMANILKELGEEEVDSKKLNLMNLDYEGANTLSFNYKNQTYQIDLKTYKTSLEEKEEDAEPYTSESPDGQWIAYVEDYNLFIKSNETGEVHQLSKDGKKDYEYASYYGWFDKMEGENGERPKRFWVNWSEDSKWIRTSICDLRKADKMYMLDYSVDSLFRPRLLSYYRGSPGDTTMVHVTPVFYDIENKREIFLDFPKVTHINPIDFRWGEKSGEVYALYTERGFKKEQLLKIDLSTKESKELISETSDTNVENFDFWVEEDLGVILFASERNGWRQLYTCNIETGEIKPITDGNYYVHDIAHIDRANKKIYFLAAGKELERNPYLQHLYSIDLDGRNLRILTTENAHHEVRFSPDGNYFIDNFSSATYPTITVLKNSESGLPVKKIGTADISKLELMGWKAPQTFEAIGRDGKTKIYGALWKPTNFDPNKKYPIIDHSYTGPHTQMYPRSFRVGLMRSNQALAELGFIVMMVDGMGSAGRSKAFRDVSYKNMGMNLRGHILAIEQLSEKYDWIDSDRVGIFGHSAGGYDAGHAMLQFPDVYKVGVSSSADHDFRMEKAWWPEMYMGWPVDSAYHEVSNVTMAGNLKGKLLLVHGSLDDNVNASATFKLAEALVKADKEFDLLIFPSQRHGYRGDHSKYFRKKRWNYFVKHLLGVEPVWDIDWNP